MANAQEGYSLYLLACGQFVQKKTGEEKRREEKRSGEKRAQLCSMVSNRPTDNRIPKDSMYDCYADSMDSNMSIRSLVPIDSMGS